HTALPHARAGKLTVIAVSGERRSVLAPDSPSFAELGLANLDIDLYFWIAGPAGLPREIVRKWNQEIASIVSAPEVRETLMKQGMVPAPGSPEEISAQIRADVERWKKFGAQPDISQYTLPLCRATAVVSSTHGQPGCAITILRLGKSAASSSIDEGCAWRIFAPMPPGSPAPMPVVPTSIITAAFSSSITSNSG